MSYKIKCTNCHHVEKESIIICSLCSKPLEVENTNEINIDNFQKIIFLRYQCFFPIDDKQFLNKYPNNPTSIIKLQGKNMYAKLEYCSFSSSIKDREAFIEIAMAKKLGYKGIAAASTGNMGAALSSFCAMFKFPCVIFIPSDTSKNKINQIKQYGAIVKKIKGTYDDIIPIVKKFSYKNNFFLAILQAYRFEGYKSVAYELYETFGKRLPTNIIIPIGDGGTFVGIWKGFEDLRLSGFINKSPSFIGVQAKQCDPIVDAYRNNTNIRIVNNPKTIAKAIQIGKPLDGEYVLKVVKTTNGQLFSYTESQILEAHKTLLEYGINAEYASALTYCPIMFNNIYDCVLIITGSGFKN